MVGVSSVILGRGGGFDGKPAFNDEARKEREFFLDETTVKKYLPAALQVIEGTF